MDDKEKRYIVSIGGYRTPSLTERRKFIEKAMEDKKIIITTNPKPNEEHFHYREFNQEDALDAVRYGLNYEILEIDELESLYPSAVDLDTGEDITNEIAKPIRRKSKAELMLERAKKRKANNKTKKRKKRKNR